MFRDILRAFLRAKHRLLPTSDDSLHHLRVNAEGRGALARVEDAESAQRSSTDVEKPPSAAEDTFQDRYACGDFVALRCDRVGDSPILSVHQGHDLVRRSLVDLCCTWIPEFRDPRNWTRVDRV